MRSTKSIIVFGTWIKKSWSKQLQVYCNLKIEDGYDVYFVSDLHKVTEYRLEGRLQLLGWPSKRPRSFGDFVFLWLLLRRTRPEVVIANFGSVSLVVLVSFLFGIKVRIAFSHSTLTIARTKNIFRQYLRFIVYRLCTHIITVNNDISQQVIRRFRIPKSKVSVLFNSYYPTKNNLLCKKEKIILTVAALEIWKGVDILINAFYNCKSILSGYKLYIIGNGSQRQSLSNLIEKLELTDCVQILGEMRFEEVQEYMRRSEIFVLPSRNDGSPQAILEAMANECVVIATAVGGIPEMIIDYKNGLLIPTVDVLDRLCNSFMTLIDDPLLKQQLSGAAKETVLQKFSATSWAEKLDKIVREN